MHALSPEQVPAARQLKAICDELGVDLVLIGAMAYRTWIDDPGRHTLDIDVAVAIDLDEFGYLTQALSSAGWKQEDKMEHRWTTLEGVRIDLLPAGPKLRKRSVLEWPISGMQMSLTGFEHVFRDSVPTSVAPHFSLKVIPLHVLALLKIVAYSENPERRQKDLMDFAAILKRYDPEDSRRFGLDILDTGLDYDLVGAYLIGRDLIPICSPEESLIVNGFIGKVRDRDSPTFRLFRRSIESEFDEPKRSLALVLIEAFAQGLGSSQKQDR
jgi:predicted nucleotidyltransferase